MKEKVLAGRYSGLASATASNQATMRGIQSPCVSAFHAAAPMKG